MDLMQHFIQQATAQTAPQTCPPQQQKAPRKPPRPPTNTGLATAKQRIVKFLEEHPGASKNRIMHVTRMKESTYLYAINILINEGAIEIVATSHTHKHYLVA